MGVQMAIKVPGEKPASETGTLLTNATVVHPRWYEYKRKKINWRHWSSFFDMELWKAIELSYGIEPEHAPDGVDEKYDRRMVIALNHMQPGALLADIKKNDKPHLTRVKLADVARLAAALGWSLPDAFPNPQPTESAPMAAKAIEATEPRQDTETLAFTQATNEKKQGPTPLKSRDIAFVFSGLRWTEEEWMKPLGDKPKWLQACVAIPAQRGVSQTHWNPVLIGAALLRVGGIKANQVRGRFQSKPQLKPWLDEWKTYEADHLDND